MNATQNGNGVAPPQHTSREIAIQQAGNMGDVLSGPAFRKQLQNILPKHLDGDRFIRIAILATTRTPKLRECTQSSLMQCLIDLTQLGLEPDGRRAHLIPYGNVCTLIIDYKGLMDLARRSGEVKNIKCEVVYEKELENGRFEYEIGTEAKLVHRPILVGERGEVVGAYSFVTLNDGVTSVHFMRKDEIEAIKKRSRASGNGPWVTDWNEMAKKTVFRQHSKSLPFSSQLHEKIEADDRHLFGFNMEPPAGSEPPVGRQKVRRGVVIDSEPVEETEQEYSQPETEAAPPQADEAPAGSTPETETEFNPDDPHCLDCGGEMYDNRATKTNPKQPDFKCKDKNCNAVIWPPKGGAKPAAPKPNQNRLTPEQQAAQNGLDLGPQVGQPKREPITYDGNSPAYLVNLMIAADKAGIEHGGDYAHAELIEIINKKRKSPIASIDELDEKNAALFESGFITGTIFGA